MTAVNPEASRQAVVEAALVLLERMGLSRADLAAIPQARKPVPTFAEYVPVVSAAVSAGTRRAYGSYWNRILEHWGGRRIDEPTPSEIRQRLHTETACRRGGALALRPQDLDPDQCLILLREKGETVRWQPVSPTLMARLVGHGQDRHAGADGQLLRYADGRPITRRRYDHLWTRIGRHLPWVATQGISTHWIRHTILTWG
jgi:integrase/recombinase XerC